MTRQEEGQRPRETIDLAAVPDFALGGVWVQPSSCRVSAGAVTDSVEPRVMQVLVALVEADRAVVSRDALIDRCWGGRIVGDDAINRCIAKIRRIAEGAEQAAFSIETVAKVGYRLVKARSGALPPTLLICDPTAGFKSPNPLNSPPEGLEPPAGVPNVKGGRAKALGLAITVVAAVLLVAMLRPAAPPADRMTLRIDRFTASSGPVAADLAAAFTQASVERLSENEVLVVSTAVGPSNDEGAAPRYVLSGTIDADGESAKIAVQVVERLTGRLLYTTQMRVPVQTSQRAVYGVVVRLLAGVEHHILDLELARYTGRPRDVEDLVIRASAEIDGWGPDRNQAGLAMGAQALARAPDNLSAQAVVAALLFCDFLASDAANGDAEGRRALRLIGRVLDKHPRNQIDRHLRAGLMAAVGDLQGARSALEGDLIDDPDNPGLQESLGAVLLQQGDVTGSLRVMPHGTAAEDGFPATQAFVQGRYADALATIQLVDGILPPDGYFMLLKAATLERLGRPAEARATLSTALPALPADLRHVAALRQVVFSLPDRSWDQFRQSLRDAGMPA